MSISKEYDKICQWNYVPLALAPLYVCIFLVVVVLIFPMLIFPGRFSSTTSLIGFSLLMIFYLVVVLIITIILIPVTFKENWRFQRKAYKAPPVRLITEVEYLLKEEKINYEKETIKSKLFSGFEKTFFVITQL